MSISQPPKNNFDFLRFMAAAMVIYSHTYDLFNAPDAEAFSSFNHGQLKLSEVGVLIFFSISGYLVYGSARRSTGLMSFFRKRILRIYPGLIFVVVSCVLLLSFLSTKGIAGYFSSPDAYAYLRNITGFWIRYGLPGVFETNPLATINGSLWTIPYELTMYAVLGITFFAFRRNVVQGFWILFLILLLLHEAHLIPAFTFPLVYLDGAYFIIFGYCFFSGAVMYYLKHERSLSFRRDWIVLVLFCVSVFLCKYDVMYLILLIPYATLIAGDRSSPSFTANFGRYGDFSYGLYLFGFPVQQLVYVVIGGRFPILISVLICIVCTLPFAVISWFLVEKRFLKLKVKNEESGLGFLKS